MTLTTPRYALRYPQTTDPDAVPLDMNHLATDLDNAMQGYSQGTLASRPAAGITGREYRATDNGFTYMDIGTAWVIKTRPIADGAGVLAYNAAWPGSPVDGQETDRYSDSTSQQIWRFRYNAASAAGFRWHFIGGAPYTTGIPFPGTGQTTRSSLAAGTNWAGVGTSYTPGIAGIFDFKLLTVVGAPSGGLLKLWEILYPSAAGSVSLATPPGGAHLAHGVYISAGASVFGQASVMGDLQIDFTGLIGTLHQVFVNADQASVNCGVGIQVKPCRCG